MDKKMTVKGRILLFLDQNGISKAEFYRLTGISLSNFKGQALNSALGSDKVVDILTAFPSLSAEWLFRGIGEMLITTPEACSHQIELAKAQHITENLSKSAIPNQTNNANDIAVSLALIDRIDAKEKLIISQAEEIGRLRAENEQLREETQKYIRCERGLLAHDNVAPRP